MAWTLDLRVARQKSTSSSGCPRAFSLFSFVGALALATASFGCSQGKTVLHLAPQESHPSSRPQTSESKPEGAKKEVTPSDRFAHLDSVEVRHRPDLGKSLPTTFSRAEVDSKNLALPAESTLWIALDDHPPRRVGKRRLRVSELLNEDQELAPGFHFLTLLDEKESGVLGYRVHPFSLEVRGDEQPPGPDCVLFTRMLTYNGPAAADDVRVMIVPLTSEVDQIRLFAEGPGFESLAQFEPGAVLGLKKPSSGDFHFQGTCLSRGVVISSPTRTITINRDALVEGESKP